MNKALENINPKNIFIALVITFAVFYSAQVSFFTSRADVLTFSSRSAAEKPVLDYAFLNEKTLLDEPALPNYHLGHTVILWLVYQLMPFDLEKSVFPAGLVSAISGGFIIGLTFLIWLELGLSKRKALIISLVTGLVPSIWFHNTFGEVYALQLLFILLFAYMFLKGRIFLSALAFLFANLVSPVSALAFSFVFLAGWEKKTLRNAFITGLIALAIYVLVYTAIGSNLLNLLNPLGTEIEGRSVFYRIGVLIFFIVLNFNFFLIYLIKGIKLARRNNTVIFTRLLLAIIPQLILLFLGSTFFIELGSFQIPLFWGLAFFTGFAISELTTNVRKVALPLIGSVLITIFFWHVPDRLAAIDRHNAGQWLKGKGINTKIIGDWNTSVGVILSKDDMNLNFLTNNYYDCPCPTEKDIRMTNEDSLIIIACKKNILRQKLAELPVQGLKIEPYNPSEVISTGKTEKIYENNSLVMYYWTKTQ